MTSTATGRRYGAAIAALLLTVGLATAAGRPAGATTAQRPAITAAASLLGSLIDFGCANPANHLSLDKLLPAQRGPISRDATCFGEVLAPQGANGPQATAGPTGLAPADIQSAYGLTGLASGGRTVAIVDAFDDPKAESDLAVYRSTFGLPPCTSATGCFTKVNQNGAKSPLPKGDAGWGMEISLDLQAVSAACPDCRLLLVEANSAGMDDLLAAIGTAKARGASAISLSWGGAEDASITAADPRLNLSGVAVTASSGDSGYGVSWPASSPFVTAVGGTTLTKSGAGWTETAWKGSGSGCSKYEPKPAWQTDPGCAKRTVADVAAVADPATGLAVYDTYNSCPFAGALCTVLLRLGLAQGAAGWIQVGGTSLSAPLIAATYALGKATGPGMTGAANSWPYGAPAGSLADVTSGSNGVCTPTYLCVARAGNDGPTGVGTPRGVTAFRPGGPVISPLHR
jgi:hypothetical protein